MDWRCCVHIRARQRRGEPSKRFEHRGRALVRNTERERLRALVAKDMDVAEKLHADDFQLINPMGLVSSKQEYLGGLRPVTCTTLYGSQTVRSRSGFTNSWQSFVTAREPTSFSEDNQSLPEVPGIPTCTKAGWPVAGGLVASDCTPGRATAIVTSRWMRAANLRLASGTWRRDLAPCGEDRARHWSLNVVVVARTVRVPSGNASRVATPPCTTRVARWLA